MNSLAALLAPLSLFVAAAPEQPASHAMPTSGVCLSDRQDADLPVAKPRSVSNKRAPAWLEMDAPYEVPSFNQVRIEQRVILRIAPRSDLRRQSLMADLPRQGVPQRFTEQKMGDCLLANSIAGVQADRGNRLLLFTRDRKMIAASLEKRCSARDFYSGFYFERNSDGNLCIDRDRILSRNGSKCKISKMRRLVPLSETR